MHTDKQQQKDFISSMFPQDSSANAIATNNQDFYTSQSAFANTQSPQDIMENLMGLSSQNMVPNFSLVQGSRHTILEQQLKIQQLQQLQQLQHQIFQQQMELLSGGQVPGPASTSSDQRQQVHGLPTPASSTELRAQPNAEFVSPMMLQHPSGYSLNAIPPQEQPPTSPQYAQHNNQHLSNSAPANIAFHMSPLPTEMDFDISPLTSPWLEAYPQQPVASSSSNKRTASPSDDESNNRPSRKRRPSVPTISRKSTQGSTPANSTPTVRPSNSNKGTGGEVPGDTPSPADLSMPPPANPASASGSNIVFYSGVTTASIEEELTPVTPASIMNLGRLGVNSSLIPPSKSNASDGKAKPTPKIKPVAEKAIKKTPAASPSLKPILPAEGSSSGQPQSQPTLYGKKSSHKDAEQKRRDSLKTSFDDLRLLLPPIPLPSDETYSGEPVLPGAMPPRGPPRPGGGPNMNVSKLQLLRCGNDYIRALKGQVERRNGEIEILRQEIRRLRSMVGAEDGEGEIDLERDLDAVEREKVAISRSDIMEADECEDG